ncbi:MAG: hypothetical protein Q9M20_02410 [Mariprofundaceae bacterium]|nr:hypothetical protein [Mariprofundaceae bacterium]
MVQPHAKEMHKKRKTIATSSASPAPIRIALLSLPLWGASLVLILFMPLTGIFSFIFIACCMFWLPLKAKRGACPHCQTFKTFPFSGFGSACKHCGHELVLRGSLIHQIEEKSQSRHGSDRSQHLRHPQHSRHSQQP